MTDILLGFEVTEPYKAAYLPLHHTGFTGMTQKAGKTTGIEAVAMRSGRQAITFQTKRGEVGFETTGTLIEPFFLERSDWQYVESLIEATMRENQRFNRSWIIRACEGTRDDLSKVWENIKEAKKTARGLALSVYTNLDAYFKLVVPQIRKYKFSKTLDLAETGVSVMNLIGMSREVQALVIRSAIDHVLQHLENVIVVIPEAWKFIGVVHTPVTYGAEQLIREGASVGNYLFIDSQDISGINSKIRGQIDNWILGRQKYEHEIDRTLKAIPIKNKPSKEEVQTLQLGHFFAACDVWVKKIYFLPWGISEEIGLEVAKGIRTPQTVKKMLEEKRKKLREDDDLVYKEKFEEEKRKREELHADNKDLITRLANESQAKLNLSRTVEALRKRNEEMRKANLDRYHGNTEKLQTKLQAAEDMEKALRRTITKLRNDVERLGFEVKDLRRESADELRKAFTKFLRLDEKVAGPPGFELGPQTVELQPTKTIVVTDPDIKHAKVSDSTIRGKILSLAKTGFFGKWQGLGDVYNGLIEKFGWTISKPSLDVELGRMVKDFLLGVKKHPSRKQKVYRLSANVKFKEA